MDMSGEVTIAASREKVWAALNDETILQAAIPGCDEIVRVDETHFTTKVRQKIGPMSTKFSGKIELTDLDPPNGYKISGSGDGGGIGFAKGGATVTLAEVSGTTTLSYEVTAQVGGKIAQLGARLIDGTAKKLADQFFVAFKRALEEESQAGQAPAAAETVVADAPMSAPAKEEAPEAGRLLGLSRPVAIGIGLGALALIVWFLTRA